MADTARECASVNGPFGSLRSLFGGYVFQRPLENTSHLPKELLAFVMFLDSLLVLFGVFVDVKMLFGLFCVGFGWFNLFSGGRTRRFGA